MICIPARKLVYALAFSLAVPALAVIGLALSPFRTDDGGWYPGDLDDDDPPGGPIYNENGDEVWW